MSFLHDDDDEAFAADWVQQGCVSPEGCLLEISITSPRQLRRRIALPDCAGWTIPELHMEKPGYSGPGYRGTVAGLMEKAAEDIARMRGGYPASVQARFDAFLGRLHRLLQGQAASPVALGAPTDTHASAAKAAPQFGCRIRIHDPSGLAAVETDSEDSEDDVDVNDTNDNESNKDEISGRRPPWATRRPMPRTWSEDVDLGTAGVDVTDPDDRLSSPADVAALLASATRVVAFTGPELSAEAGMLPTTIFESVFAAAADAAGRHGQAAGPLDYNRCATTRARVWEAKRLHHRFAQRAAPTDGHAFFCELARRGQLSAVVSLSVDSLHRRSGLPDSRLVELHGHLRELLCCDLAADDANPRPIAAGRCSYRLSDPAAVDALLSGFEGGPSCEGDDNDAESSVTPTCPECAHPLRSAVVLPGQPLPPSALSRAEEALATCDLLLLVGTGALQTRPANQLPALAVRRGVPVVVVNTEESPFDRFAHALVRRSPAEFLRQVAELLPPLGAVSGNARDTAE